MALRTGDIDDLYDWSDENSERGNGASPSPDEQRVGTAQASFEQLLERELAKEQARNGGSQRRRAAPTKPRRQFLKKGARGWWMEDPDAKQKMQKHVLESVELDESNNQASTQRTATTQRKSSSTGARRSPQASSAGTASPEPVRKDDVAPVRISPVRPSPSPRRDDRPAIAAPQRNLPLWATANTNMRTNESVETLNMSGVRHDFESRREKEATELADFEALEQELAAEKESYLREKHGMDDRGSKAYYADDDEDSWLRESDDAASLQGESRHLLSGGFRSSYSNLDLRGESSMVFDGDRVFRSPLPRATSARESLRPRHSRPSFDPSDISAVSLNDSEPWGDANVLDHFSQLSESPIAKHGVTSVLLNGGSRSRAAANSSGYRDSLWTGKGEDRAFEDVDNVEESLTHYDEYDNSKEGHARRSLSQHGAPVSTLVQRVFGAAAHAAEDQDDEDYQSTAQPARTGNRKIAGAVAPTNSAVSSLRQPRNTQARKSVRQPSNRDQRVEEEQRDRIFRRTTPGINPTGMLPVSIEDKLAELEEEVKFYKSETLQLQRKKTQYDDEMQRLAREKESIARVQEEQRQLIAQEWHEQRQKMKHEERLFERQMKLKLSAATSAGSRKDRAEIDALKAQIVALQLEAKQSSAKMKSTNEVLRQRIGELEGKNRELSEEIKFLERDRLDQWQRYEDLLKELNSHKLKQDSDRDQLKTVGDISRVGRSAEQILSSLQQPDTGITRNRSPDGPSSTIRTPTHERGGEYNPGRYSPSEISRARSTQSSQSGSVHSKENDDRNALDSSRGVDADDTVDEVVHPGGKRETTYRDGTKRIFFADGNEKEILPNGDVVIRFTNGDRKEYFPSTGVSVYHYHEAQTKLTTYPDKTKVYEFPNQQTEKSYPDGTTEIQFADGIMKTIHPSGDEYSKFPDGTTMLETKDGLREVTLLNSKKVRYYPDGKMTLVNRDGQESEVRSDEELRELMESA